MKFTKRRAINNGAHTFVQFLVGLMAVSAQKQLKNDAERKR